MAGIPDLVKLVKDLATYEERAAEGKTSDGVIYLVLAERKVFFNGEDWTAGGSADITVDEELSETSDNPVQNAAVTQVILDNEEVTAAALNDLDSRINEISELVTGETVTKVEFEESVTTLTNSIEKKADASETSDALNSLQTSIDEINTSLADYATTEGLANEVAAITEVILDNEEVTAAALNDLDSRINDILIRLNNAGL